MCTSVWHWEALGGTGGAASALAAVCVFVSPRLGKGLSTSWMVDGMLLVHGSGMGVRRV